MNELEELPNIGDVPVIDIPNPVINSPVTKIKRTKKNKKKAPVISKKQQLVNRYLKNFDASKNVPPSEEEMKGYTVVKLQTLCTLQEKQQTHKMQPSGLAVSLIGFVSNILDFLAKTDNEITRLNAEDDELKRCVAEELGSLATYLNNKVKIASHLTLNTGRAVVKKRKYDQVKEKENDQVTNTSRKKQTTERTAKP
jgi:hypothetical protein